MESDERIIPIPIDENEIVKVFIPTPLAFRKADAEKVCRVLMALAIEEQS